MMCGRPFSCAGFDTRDLKGAAVILNRSLQRVVWAGLLGSILGATGCTVSAHAGYYYDPYDHRYYAPANEDIYIQQWENETHRRHEEFRRRRNDQRREYWQWRQQHGHDRDRDHDRDHDRR
jgi:PAS domain-containing protein